MKNRSHVSPPSQRARSKALPAADSQHTLKLYALLGLPLAAAGLLFLSSFL